MIECVDHQGVERLFRDLAEHQEDERLCANICFAFHALLANSMRVTDIGFMTRVVDMTNVPLLLSILERHQESAAVVYPVCDILQILAQQETPLIATGAQRLVGLLVQVIQHHKGENEVYRNALTTFQSIVMPNPIMIGYLCELFTSDAFWEPAKPLGERRRLFDVKYFFIAFLAGFARIFKDGDEPLCHACIPALIRIDLERMRLYPHSAQLNFSATSSFVIAYDRFKNTPGHEADWDMFRTGFLHLSPEPVAASGAVAMNRKAYRKAYRKTYRKTYRKACRKTSRKTR